MKLKKYVTIYVVILIIISAVIILYPLASLEYERHGNYNSPLKNGVCYHYSIDEITGNSYKLINGTPYIFYQSGYININIENNNAHINLFIHTNIFQTKCKHINYYKNFTKKSNSQFMQNFINNFSTRKDSIWKIENQELIVQRRVSIPYTSSYSGKNRTILNNANAMGKTLPVKVLVPNINNNHTMGTGIYKNNYEYDSSDNYNILVSTFLYGNSYFLSKLFDNSTKTKGYNKLVGVAGLRIKLISTNVNINPVAYVKYLTSNDQFIPILIIPALIYLYISIKIAKRENK